jgi:hypothetical protein
VKTAIAAFVGVASVLRQAVLLLWNLSSNNGNLAEFRADEKLVTLVQLAQDVYGTPCVRWSPTCPVPCCVVVLMWR